MITLNNIKKTYDEATLFEDVNLTFNINDKIAIVGDNGVGKTTLLNIIRDDEHATFGEVIYSNHTVEFLDQQQQLEGFDTINDVINSLMSRFTNIKKRINEIINDDNFAYSDELIKEYGELENKFVTLGGYEYESEIKKVFTKLYFSSNMYTKKISELSGGQRTRLALAKIIIRNPDYLILDEPTNHLDIQAIEWLEEYLRVKAKGVIVVSHDRFFVNRVCNKIIEIDNQQVSVYNTDYEGYKIEKKLRYEHQLRAYNNQQLEIKTYQEFIEKNRAKPTKIGQVNDRKSKLERLELIEKPKNNYDKVNFKLEGLRDKRDAYLELIDVNVGYDKPIINNINLTLNAGDKIGLVGENASGKSTLVKTITKQIKQMDGIVALHPKINIGYFDQNFLNIDNNLTVYQEIEQLMPNETQAAIRKHLAQFLFKGQDVFKTVDKLSGGEKVKLIFAKLVIQKYDLLIMDEPTNHLDLKTKEELEEILGLYTGALILVSHDRFFINKIVNRLWIIENQHIEIYEGKYLDYIEQKKEYKSTTIKQKKKTIKISKNQINENKKIEKKIIQLEEKLEYINSQSLLEENYTNYEKMAEFNLMTNEINEELNRLYENLQ